MSTKSTFDISGMSCSACSARVEKAVSKLDGASQVNVNLLSQKMTLDIDQDKLSEEEVIQAVEKAGYLSLIHI